jgi:uncharacterized membrane protein YdbT with pleckstrin-like domain
MEDRTIHPSMKGIWAGYLLAVVVVGAGIWAYYTFGSDRPVWLMAIPCVLLLIPIRAQLRRSLVTLRLHDDQLTLETGFFSRTRRTFNMAKIQDVTVKQSLLQRIVGTGDLTLESAGESSRISIQNVDSPRAIADAIIAGSKRSAAQHGNP